ncbi:hypothetical protein D3C87_680360 [compost metagenome]
MHKNQLNDSPFQGRHCWYEATLLLWVGKSITSVSTSDRCKIAFPIKRDRLSFLLAMTILLLGLSMVSFCKTRVTFRPEARAPGLTFSNKKGLSALYT